MENTLTEYRCSQNGYLLCKAYGVGQIEIINPSNRIMNYVGPSRVGPDVGPRGQEFGTYAVFMRCSKCERLLGKAVGLDMHCEIKCHHCKTMNKFELKEMMEPRFYNMSSIRRKQVEEQILGSIGLKGVDNK